jgi:hypothetical protein
MAVAVCLNRISMFPEYAGVITSIDDHHENYRDLYIKRRDEVGFDGPEPNVWEIEL